MSERRCPRCLVSSHPLQLHPHTEKSKTKPCKFNSCPELNLQVGAEQPVAGKDQADKKKKEIWRERDIPLNIFKRKLWAFGNWTQDLGVETTQPLALQYQVHLKIKLTELRIPGKPQSRLQTWIRQGNRLAWTAATSRLEQQEAAAAEAMARRRGAADAEDAWSPLRPLQMHSHTSAASSSSFSSFRLLSFLPLQ